MKNEILDSFIEEAIEHGAGTLAGDHNRTNDAYHKLIVALKNLKSGDPKFTSLLPLLNHKNQSVRVWAATYLLPHAEERALQTLRNLSQEKGFVAFDAEVVTKEWESGRLKLPL